MSRPSSSATSTSEEQVLDATRAAARGRATRCMTCTRPYAVHGMDEAMGLKPSRLTWVCFGAGLLGCTLGAVAPVLHVGGELAAQRGRQALQLAARPSSPWPSSSPCCSRASSPWRPSCCARSLPRQQARGAAPGDGRPLRPGARARTGSDAKVPEHARATARWRLDADGGGVVKRAPGWSPRCSPRGLGLRAGRVPAQPGVRAGHGAAPCRTTASRPTPTRATARR